MKLFDDQEKLVSDIGLAMKRGAKRVAACAVTGFGKTVVGTNIAKRAYMKGNNSCILTHRVEIFKQFYRSLMRVGIQPETIISDATFNSLSDFYDDLYSDGLKLDRSPNKNARPGFPIYLGMVETFNRRMNRGVLDQLHIDMYQMDEAHWGAYPKVLDQVDGHIIGWTATPKTTGSPHMKDMYDDIVVGPSVSDLIKLGRLCKGLTFSVKYDFTKVKKKGGEFEDKALLQEFKKAKLYDGAVKKYMELCPDRKCICYNVNIEHSKDVELQFLNAGIERVFHVDGNTPDDERDRIFREFDAAEHAVLCNVGVATTGYDCPSVRCIIENFATMSITKHHQCIGRGARTCHGKEDFYIIDMGRNYLRFQEYGAEVDWRGIFLDPSIGRAKDEKEVKKTKRECSECGYLVPMQSKYCPNCNMIWSKTEIESFMLEGATMELIREHRLQNLPIHLRKPHHDMTLKELQEFGFHMNYKPSWAWTIKNQIDKRRNHWQNRNRNNL